MSRRVAFPILASGIGLLALAATVLPFEDQAVALAQRAPWDRIQALGPVAGTALALALFALAACWRKPRHPLSLVLLALALGTASGTATLMAVPELLGHSGPVLALAN